MGEAARDAKTIERAAALSAELTVIRDKALAVLNAKDLSSAMDIIAETVSVARRANAEGISTLSGAAQAAGVLPLPYTEPPAIGTPMAAMVTIVEENYDFTPFQITVSVGTTVIWVNKDRAKHTVTAADGSFDSDDQGTNQNFQHTFDTPGRYNYFCRYHGDKGDVGMAGTVIVE